MVELLSRKRKAIITSALVLEVDDEKKQNKKQRKWSKQWLSERRKCLLRELQLNKSEDFKNYLRVENQALYELLSLVRPLIKTKLR